MSLIKGKHLGAFAMLPAAPDKCKECATAHKPDQAHNAQSIFYQYHFYNEHGRWPNWKDAIAHCAPEVQEQWKKLLTEAGVDVEGGKVNPAK